MLCVQYSVMVGEVIKFDVVSYIMSSQFRGIFDFLMNWVGEVY